MNANALRHLMGRKPEPEPDYDAIAALRKAKGIIERSLEYYQTKLAMINETLDFIDGTPEARAVIARLDAISNFKQPEDDDEPAVAN